MEHIYEIGLAIVVATAGLRTWKKHMAAAAAANDSAKTTTIDQSTVREIHRAITGSNIRVKMDETKRKSLAVGNRHLVPAGWENVVTATSSGDPTPKTVMVEKLKGEFAHKFYGSQLMIGDRIVVGSLPKKLHTLEITDQDQVFIDGVPQLLHVSDIEDLKRVVHNAQLK